MNSNRFNVLESGSESDFESVCSDTEIHNDENQEKEFACPSEDNQIGNFLPLTIDNLARIVQMNSMGLIGSYGQVCAEEPAVITEVKTKLLNTLIQSLRKKVIGGFRGVYTTDSIFELLRGLPVYNYIREVAKGEEGDYQGRRQKMFQYKYYETIINITAFSSWGSCSYCDADLALEDEIQFGKFSLDKVLKKLEDDLRCKFASMKFFIDFTEACNFVKSRGKAYGIKMKFAQNQKTIERKNHEKEERETRKAQLKKDLKNFPKQSIPQRINLSDFIPLNLT